MQLSCRRGLLIAAVLNLTIMLAAQTQAPAHKSAATKRYCHPEVNFCFQYPASWTTVGKIFNSNGIVVAPPQKQEQSLWDAVTVALVVLPPEGDEEPLNLNGVIEQASTALRQEGQNFQTQQRQELTVDHKPAQMIKVGYHEKTNDRDWIEQLVFIEGPDNEIYSVALKCAPQNLVRLEPAFKGILASWKLPEPAPPEEESPAKPAPPL
ncbi:MAG: LpqN/LpqT family lipoprotein [Acidobacteriota bacterium]|nr:LpqN/LpqT family lipoprotein [Acidobacteriota bacterium]